MYIKNYMLDKQIILHYYIEYTQVPRIQSMPQASKNHTRVLLECKKNISIKFVFGIKF